MGRRVHLFMAALLAGMFFMAAEAGAAAKDFNAKAFGLSGHYSMVQELSGNFKDGTDNAVTVRLIGKHEQKSPFYNGFWLEILAENGGKSTLVPLRKNVEGYDPYMEARNFRYPARSEIFLSLQSGGSGGLGNYFIFEITDENKIRYLFDSDADQPPSVKANFLDQYQGEITVEATGTQARVDLTSRRKQYEEQGVYDPKTGVLKEAVEIWGGGYSSLIAMDGDNNGIDELRGVLELSGTSHADRVASVIYTMAYYDGKWTVINDRIAPAEGLTLMRPPRVAK